LPKDWCDEEKTYFIIFDLERQKSFAYVPVRDQNLVVRSKIKDQLICLMFFIFLKKLL